MAARQTTLGALTAADLGKRVRVAARLITPFVARLRRVEHHLGGTRVVLGADYQVDVTDDPDTPVTVYDEEADDDR